MKPPAKNGNRHEECGERGKNNTGDEAGDRQVRGGGFGSQGDLRPMQAEVGEHEEGNHGKNGKGLCSARLGKRWGNGPAHGGNSDAHEDYEGDEVEKREEAMMDGGRQEGKTYPGKEPSYEEFAVGNDENKERPEDDEMIDAKGAAHDPLLAEGTGQHSLQPFRWPVEAVLGRAGGDQAQPFVTAVTKQEDGEQEYWRKNKRM